jgi:hypothetical protein
MVPREMLFLHGYTDRLSARALCADAYKFNVAEKYFLSAYGS